MFPGQLLSRPLGGDARRRAEIFQVDSAYSGPIMVARNNDICSFAQFEDAFVRIWPITNQVAQEPDLINRLLFSDLVDFRQYSL